MLIKYKALGIDGGMVWVFLHISHICGLLFSYVWRGRQMCIGWVDDE